MDIFDHEKRWRITGVCPLGAQVERTDGSRLTPLSSAKTIQARRRRALFYARPLLLHPAHDGLVVAFEGSASGALPCPVHALAQDLPHAGLRV
jgi:hypothetical protein